MKVSLGYQQLTGIAVATGLTVPNGATEVDITIEGAAVRWRDDQVAPTASVGMLAPISNQGPSPWTYRSNPRAIRFIQTAAGSVVNCEFFGHRN